jgi:hypothetical protein
VAKQVILKANVPLLKVEKEAEAVTKEVVLKKAKILTEEVVVTEAEVTKKKKVAIVK